MLQDSESSASSGDEAETKGFKVPRRQGYARSASDASTGRGTCPSFDLGLGSDILGSLPARRQSRDQLPSAFSLDALDSEIERTSPSLTMLHPSARERGSPGGSPRNSPLHQGGSPLQGGSRGASPSVEDLSDYVVVSKGGAYVCMCVCSMCRSVCVCVVEQSNSPEPNIIIVLILFEEWKPLYQELK